MLLQANAFRIPLPNKSVHCAVTSPPYWGLRKYAGDQGDEPLGLEATPERHIERMVEIFREVRRVLRDDGVCWLNYGDSYFGDSPVRTSGSEAFSKEWDTSQTASRGGPRRSAASVAGLRPGCLTLIPHRLAIALIDDGWIIRNDVVWYKRNPMPESVAGWRWERRRTKTKDGNTSIGQLDREEGKASWTVFSGQGTRRNELDNPEYEYGDDYVLKKSSWRHTRAHEYVFQLVKKMGYYCNQEAVRETTQGKQATGTEGAFHDHDNDKGRGQRISKKLDHPSGRNPRSVMDVPTAPYKGAHYATFPPKLIAPLIRASCPRRACPECGQAWAAVVENPKIPDELRNRSDDTKMSFKPTQLGGGQVIQDWRDNNPSSVSSYRPTCECERACKTCKGIGHSAPSGIPKSCPVCDGAGYIAHKPVPGKVLDIFGGSGTTGMVAKELLRDWIVMDISRPYLDEQAKIRTKTSAPSNSLEGLPLFNEIIREED